MRPEYSLRVFIVSFPWEITVVVYVRIQMIVFNKL